MVASGKNEVLGVDMKIFRKERLPNGRRHIYFCGIKIFSYSKKHYVSNPVGWDYALAMAENIFVRDGYNEFEYNVLKHWFMNNRVLANYDVQMVWLIFMAAAFEMGDLSLARNVFVSYNQRFGLNWVGVYLPVCRLAKSIGVSDESIDKMLAVGDKVAKVRSEKRFENIIKKAKSIAIVGRSPVLIGMGRGAEIDAHDVVIRFNMADVSGKYASDFGVKNDVMVINCWNKNDKQTFCIYKDFRTYGCAQEVINSIAEDDCENVDFLDFGLKAWCCRESGLVDPTSGAIIIMWVKKILGNLNKVDIYGFAFQDENMNLGHYDGNYQINDNIHNMRAEIEFLKQFTNKEV